MDMGFLPEPASLYWVEVEVLNRESGSTSLFILRETADTEDQAVLRALARFPHTLITRPLGVEAA